MLLGLDALKQRPCSDSDHRKASMQLSLMVQGWITTQPMHAGLVKMIREQAWTVQNALPLFRCSLPSSTTGSVTLNRSFMVLEAVLC